MLDALHEGIDEQPTLQRAVDVLDHLRPRPLKPVTRARAPQAVRPQEERLFSVVVPCYNYGRFLEEAVRSALGQVGVGVEVIVVDDASTDSTPEVARRLAERDSRVRYLRNDENLGHVRTFNVGLAETVGDFVVRLDADDLIAAGAFARAAALFEAFPSVGLVYGHPRHFTTATPPAARSGPVSWIVWSGQAWVAERCRTGVNCITTPEAVVRSSVMDEVGGLRTELRFAQDMEMWMRVASVSNVGRINGADQALHRDHDSSMSVTVGAGAITDLKERREVFRLIVDKMGNHFSSPSSLDELARRALAKEALRAATHAFDRGKVGDVPIGELVSFAAATWPDLQQLPEWRALRSRQRVGARRARMAPPFIFAALRRRIDSELRYARWTRHGV